LGNAKELGAEVRVKDVSALSRVSFDREQSILTMTEIFEGK